MWTRWSLNSKLPANARIRPRNRYPRRHEQKSIVLDANILIRAVLGKRARELIVDNAEMVQFFAPDVAP
jgi:hypothetical protein